MLKLLILYALVAFKITKEFNPPGFTTCGNITCLANAQCKNTSQGGQICQCLSGYRGPTCNDIDECRSDRICKHRGHCINTIGSYRCKCLQGWIGENMHCKDRNNSSNVYLCMPGWMGDLCEDQCLNSSMCRSTEVCKTRNGMTGMSCLCAPGWTGINCTADIDECSSKPCNGNHTICKNTPGSYQCDCLSGWKGINCSEDINECILNPCQHSSICTNAPGYYNCTCERGWNDVNCSKDIDECIAVTCSTKEHCINTLGSFECRCNDGWKGVNCDVDIDECESFPCLRSTTCENTPGSYICRCNYGWSGLNCEVEEVRRKYTIVGISLCSLLFGCSVATMIGVIKFKCFKVQPNTKNSAKIPKAKVGQTVQKQRDNNYQMQHNKPDYHMSQKQTLQLDVHLHQVQQNPGTSKIKHINDTEVQPKQGTSKHDFQIDKDHHSQNDYKNKDEESQFESYRHCDPKAEKGVINDKEEYWDKNNQELQDPKSQDEDQQSEGEYRSKYWLRKLKRYFIRIKNPLWRY